MKNLSLKFVLALFFFFALFSFLLYVLEISAFIFPHFSIVMTLLYTEKNVKKRIAYTLIAVLIYSQIAAPLPLFFLFITAFQISILTHLFFTSTAFDYPLTAVINCILSSFLLNLNRFLYLYIFVGEVKLLQLFSSFLFSAFVLILLFVLFKSKVNSLFKKESWL